MKDNTRKAFSLTSLTITSGLMTAGYFGFGPFAWDTGAVFALLTAYGCFEVLLHSLPAPYAGSKEATENKRRPETIFPAVFMARKAA